MGREAYGDGEGRGRDEDGARKSYTEEMKKEVIEKEWRKGDVSRYETDGLGWEGWEGGEGCGWGWGWGWLGLVGVGWG